MTESTYRVVKLEVDASIDGKPCGFKVPRYYATFLGREPKTSGPMVDPFVEVWADKSITLHHGGRRIFLYDDQWRGIVSALKTAMRDIDEAKTSSLSAWLKTTEHATEFDGVRVDLSRAQVIEALTSCPIELEDQLYGGTEPVIIFNGERHDLCRTDLLNDVATGLCAKKSAAQWRAHYLKAARTCFGGRITKSAQGHRLFAVIDSATDG
jgi:hypothetical protein